MGKAPDVEGGDTEAACKMRAVSRFVEMRNRVWPTREKYARAVGLKQDSDDAAQAKAPRYQTVNLSFRYVQGLSAEVTGEPLHLKMNRDAGPGQSVDGQALAAFLATPPQMPGLMPGAPMNGAPLNGQPSPPPMGQPGMGPPGMGAMAPQPQGAVGDEEVAEWVERGASRVIYEANFTRECNAVVTDLAAYGVSGFWIGYHSEIVDATEAVESAKDVAGDVDEQGVPDDTPAIIAEALAGDVEAKPGQDHASIAPILRDAAAQLPLTQPEAMQRLHARAQSHDALAAKEGKAKVGQTREIARRIWIRRGCVGLDTFWAPSVSDFGDTPFVCRRVLTPLESFKRWPVIKPEYREKAEGQADRYKPSVGNANSSKASDEYRDANDPYDKYVECYEFWLREPWRPDGGRRKIACPEFKGEWIEANEKNPHVDDNGRQLIPGFFPFFYIAPLLPPIEEPERTLATSLVAPGARTEERINEFLSTILAHYKRHGFRVYALHPLMKGMKKVREALRQGIDGFSFNAPPGVTDPKEMQSLIVPIQFSGQAEQMERMLTKLIEFWRIEQGVPAAVLLGQAMADTATQEEIGVDAGQNEMAVIAARIEEPVGEMVRGVLGLMRGFYNTERMRELLGSEGARAWDQYRKTSIQGDRMEVMLGRRAKKAAAVDRKQLMETIEIDRSTTDPVTGVRVLDDMPLVEELHRAIGSGKPKKLPAAAMFAQQLIAGLMQENAALKGTQPGAKPGGEKPGGEPPSGSAGRDEGPPNRENINAGVRRGTAAGATA